jgi:GNAT superfamily N-acetyltransferase
MDAIGLHHILRVMDFHPVEANLRQSFRALAEGRPKGDVLELPGISIASLGASFQMFNTTFLSTPVPTQAALEARLNQARQHFRSRDLGWAFWICEDWLDWSIRRSLTQTCQRFGLRLSSELPGMIGMPPLPRPKRPLPPLEIRRVDSARILDDFRAIGSVSFHVPYEWFSEVFDASVPAGRPGFACYVGYHEGEPVATSASVRSEGVAGLYNIATAPARRGRGYGEAITRLTIESASVENASVENASSDGVPEPIVLQSTSQGRRIYERLGFQTVTRILVFNSV